MSLFSDSSILVQRLEGGLGDVLCCTVAARAAQERYEGAHIVFACYEQVLPFIVDQLPGVVVVAPCKVAYGNRLEKLKPTDFDGLPGDDWAQRFDLQGPEIRYARRVNYDIKESRLITWLKYVDNVLDDPRPRWSPKPGERQQFISEWLIPAELEPFGYVVVQYASAMREKNWPGVDRMIEVLRDSGVKVVVAHNNKVPDFSVPEKRDSKGRLVQEGVPVWQTSGAMGSCPLRSLGMLAEQAALVIGPDSFLTHLSAATDTPYLGLFGPTDAAVITKYYPLAHTLQYEDMGDHSCAKTFPCWGVDHRNYWCRLREGKLSWCLEQLKPDAVASKALNMIEQYSDFNRKKQVTLSSDGGDIVDARSVPRGRSPSHKALVVAVPPGIGDSVWAMTKIPDMKKKEGADRVIILAKKTVPLRSVDFLKRFAFVDDARYAEFPIHPLNAHHLYTDGPHKGTYRYERTMRDYWGADHLLIPNTPLERGERLETWLPEYETKWDICINDLKFTDADEREASVIAAEAGRYAVFFCGSLVANRRDGHNRLSRWRDEDWIELSRILHERQGLNIVLVGAPYDLEYVDALKKANGGSLPDHWTNVVAKTRIMVTYAICKRSVCVIGYQSGVPIVSCLLGVPAASFWRAHGDSLSQSDYITFNEDMRNAWVPPWALESGQWLGCVYGKVAPMSIVDHGEQHGWFSDSPPHYWAKQSSHILR